MNCYKRNKKVPVKVVLTTHLDNAAMHLHRAMQYDRGNLVVRAGHALDNYARHLDGAIEQITRPS